MKLDHALAVLLAVAVPASASAQDFQVGARAKGMGGSYTAFEDDPVSIWMNPAGIATQPQSMSIVYQSFTQYELDNTIVTDAGFAEFGLISPVLLPAFLGFVFPFRFQDVLGFKELPCAIGVGYMRPVHLHLTFDRDLGSDDGIPDVDRIEDQEFSRFRTSFAFDLRIKPVGEAGWFTHVALGGGVDIGYTEWRESTVAAGSVTETNSDRRSQVSNGYGLLVGVYDNTEDLKVNFGIAWNRAFFFQFQTDQADAPVFDWPTLLNVGASFYVMKGMRLRVTVDMQTIDWKGAAGQSLLANRDSIRDVRNFSMGGEYKLRLKDDGSLLGFLRVGFRLLQTMWADGSVGDLPAIGQNILSIHTEANDGTFQVLTWGFGFYWTTPEGKSRGIDVGTETKGWFGLGADAFNVAFGYTHEF